MATTPAISEWPAPRGDEKGEVYLWRQDQFRELGFNRLEAAELAVSEADLAQARYLVSSGCSPELALRILR
jgi:alpha-tubulin suppressor-like RCC1 family protein